MKEKILKYEGIRNLRVDKRISQKVMAQYLNVAQNTYSQYEIGEINYSVDVIIKLAIYYGTSADYLLGLTDEKMPYPGSGKPTYN